MSLSDLLDDAAPPEVDFRFDLPTLEASARHLRRRRTAALSLAAAMVVGGIAVGLGTLSALPRSQVEFAERPDAVVSSGHQASEKAPEKAQGPMTPEEAQRWVTFPILVPPANTVETYRNEGGSLASKRVWDKRGQRMWFYEYSMQWRRGRGDRSGHGGAVLTLEQRTDTGRPDDLASLQMTRLDDGTRAYVSDLGDDGAAISWWRHGGYYLLSSSTDGPGAVRRFASELQPVGGG